MSKANQHIDDKFRDAFKDWEADFSVSEMNADWDAFSKKIPQQQELPQKPEVKSPTVNPMAAAKILGLSTAAGLIITAATILLYNSNNTDTENKLPVYENTSNAAEKIAEENAKEIQSIKPSLQSKQEEIKQEEPGNKVKKNSKEINKQENYTVNQNISSENTGKDNFFFPGTLKVSEPVGNKQNENIVAASIKQVKTNELADITICQSFALTINNTNQDSETRVEWGDGKITFSTSQANISHNYEKPGKYNLKIERKNEIILRKVIVNAGPQAHFTNFQSNGLTCKFKNLSEGANGYKWIFGDNTYPQSSYNAEHTFQDSGKFLVKLIAYNSGGCTDTLVQPVYVSNRNSYAIPNVITPDNDGNNDVFDVKINNTTSFELIIMEASGQVVFTSRDKNYRWDGNNQNTGEACKPGTYIYAIKYQLAGENMNQLSGFITLLR